jgi:formate hydrogenlyase subunit 3/multisubunit Na+/H+ antiporter MnhD subunit
MSKSKTSKQQGKPVKGISDFKTFSTVFFYCFLIIFLPIVSFFGSKSIIFDNFLNLSSMQSNIYSAVVAVVALHIALGLYLYRAYFDHSDQTSPTRTTNEKED